MIDSVAVNAVPDKSGGSMKCVFLVSHLHDFGDDREEVKIIGVYETEADAHAAVARLEDKPGFCDRIEGFHVTEYEVNKDHWQDGYVTDFYYRAD